MKYWLGIDLGGTKLRVGAVDEDGKLAALREALSGEHSDTAGIREQILAMARELTLKYPAERAGICVPGAVSGDGRILHMTNLRNVSLDAAFFKELERKMGIPLVIENDANAAAFGEYCYGSGRGAESLFYVTISTGIGGGYIWKGNIIHGFSGFAGEVGSILTKSGGTPFRGLVAGTVEGSASGSAISEEGRKRIGPGISDAGEVFRLAQEGNAAAEEIVEEMTEALARMFTAITVTVNPEVFVLGGGCMKSADVFLDKMTARYRELAPKEIRETGFLLSCLKEPGIIGCAELARRAKV